MTRSISVPVFSLGLALLLAGGCDKPDSELPVVSMAIGSKTYNLEVADTDASREHGLMERDTLADDHGMIFVFDSGENELDFWMRHTRFDLDIVFADGDGRVVSTSTMKAYDENTHTKSGGPAKYAIELASGQDAANGVKAGDVLKLPDRVKPKPSTAAASH